MSAVSSPPTDDPLLEVYTAPYEKYAGICLRIRTKESGMQPFLFNRPQKIVEAKVTIQKAEIGRIRALILKSRQLGMTTWIGGRFWKKVHLTPSVLGMVLADKAKRSEEIFQIYDRFRLNLPEDVQPTVRLASKRRLHLSTDSGLVVDTAGDPDVGRGLTLQLIHASEVGFWEKPEEAMLSLLNAATQDAEVYLESTANGVGNYFHRAWKAAESGESSYIPIFLPWWCHEEYRWAIEARERNEILATTDPWEREALDQGIAWEPPGPGIPRELESGAKYDARRKTWRLSPEQLAWRRREFEAKFGGFRAGDAIPQGFRQEHPSTAAEAFIVSGNVYFDADRLVELEKLCVPPIERLNWIRTGRKGFRPQRNERGYVKVWERPNPKGHYVLGGDTAEGKMAAQQDTTFDDPEGERGGRDFCAGYVIRLGYWEGRKPNKVWHHPRVVASVHQRMAPEVFAEQMWATGNWYACPGTTHRFPALMGIERNHDSGRTVLRVLRHELAYPNLFWHQQINVRSEKPTVELGWWTSAETRGPMLDELARMVREGTLGIPDAGLISEMLTFVRGLDGKPAAQEGCHDDRVIAAGVAGQMMRHHHDEPAGKVPQYEVQDTPSGM